MPRRVTSGVGATVDPNDPTRAFWKFTEPDMPPVQGYGNPYSTAAPTTYLGTPGVDYRHSIPNDAPRASIPRSTGQPTVQVKPQVVSWDGRPIVESSADIFPGDTREQTFVYDPSEQHFSIPHSAMDFSDNAVSGSLEATATRPVGEPTVQTPTATPAFASAGHLDAEPSLFPNTATNPFDEWWKTPSNVTGNANAGVEATGTGGSIWAEANAVPLLAQAEAGMSDTSRGARSASGELTATAPPPDETGLNQPPPPRPIAIGDAEWTTTPEDRRWLAEPEATDAPPPIQSGGPDIRNFAGQGYGNPISLGAYLNTPLSNLNYGQGYPVGESTYGGPPVASTGSVQIDPQTGQPYDLNSIPTLAQGGTDTTGSENIPTGVAVSPEVRPGELVENAGSPSFGLPGQYGTPLHESVTARNPGYDSISTSSPNRGYGQSMPSAEGAKLMNFAASSPTIGPLAFQWLTGDSGQSQFSVRNAHDSEGNSLFGTSGVHMTPAQLAAGRAWAHQLFLWTTGRESKPVSPAGQRGVTPSSQSRSTTATSGGGR